MRHGKGHSRVSQCPWREEKIYIKHFSVYQIFFWRIHVWVSAMFLYTHIYQVLVSCLRKHLRKIGRWRKWFICLFCVMNFVYLKGLALGGGASFWTGSQSKLPSVLPMETENTLEFLVLPFLSPVYYDYRHAHTQNKIIRKKIRKV